MYLLVFIRFYGVLKGNIKRLVTKMDLFKKESILSQIANAESMSIRASRVYAAVLSISVFTVIIFKTFEQTTVSETIPYPSLATFEQLQSQFPSTLSCSCQRIGIFYATFASITPKMHQVSYFTIMCLCQ